MVYSRLPTPDSRLPTPDSRFPIPDSRFPVPSIYSQLKMLNTSTEMISFPALTETLTLELEQQQQALDIANQMAEKPGTLAIYLQELALLVFEDWLEKREPSLRLERAANGLGESGLSQAISQAINAVCNLQVGEFKICLIPTFGFSDPFVNLPQAIVTIPQFTAHFYVVIAIDDDLGIAGIKGVNDSAIMKTSVVSDEFRERYLSNPDDPDAFEGRAIVFDGPEDYHPTTISNKRSIRNPVGRFWQGPGDWPDRAVSRGLGNAR
ncbi:MAG: DUF1822 family protein, partial [Moorea sp. SIO1F2]|uniref:DUF1822 family protein n=1 Tax=Moorena sp. SIO1F2 TaxID=2607819 RepID=UPI0013BDB44F